MGKFEQGHTKVGGKTKGSKNKKTVQWEALGEYIESGLAEGIKKTIQDLMESNNIKYKVLAVELSIKVLNYFKPKYQNTTSEIQITGDPIVFIEPKDDEA